MDDPKDAAREALKTLRDESLCAWYFVRDSCADEDDSCDRCTAIRTLTAYIARLEREQGEVMGTLHVGTIGARIIPPNGEPMKVGDWLDRAAPDFYKIVTIPEQSDD